MTRSMALLLCNPLPGFARLAGACALAFAMLVQPAAVPRAHAQEVHEGAALLEAVDRVRAPGDHFVFDVDLQDQGGTRLELRVMIRDLTNGLVRYLSPANVAGRSILYRGRAMWVYVPGARRELRISPQQRVLGGVASADIARVIFSEDYQVASKSAGPDGLKMLHLVSRGGDAAYARVNLAIDPANNHPVFAEFYAAIGTRRIKTLHFEGYRQVLGRLRPMVIRIVDHMDGDTVTRMTFSNMRLEETPAAWFQPSFLRHLN